VCGPEGLFVPLLVGGGVGGSPIFCGVGGGVCLKNFTGGCGCRTPHCPPSYLRVLSPFSIRSLVCWLKHLKLKLSSPGPKSMTSKYYDRKITSFLNQKPEKDWACPWTPTMAPAVLVRFRRKFSQEIWKGGREENLH